MMALQFSISLPVFHGVIIDGVFPIKVVFNPSTELDSDIADS